ncbi:MAG: PilZ domain-containing protein [Thermoanaerobaculia bacterium]|nr:PilZ domain-containing protein [Thermoanaerobaculia bacterium]
MMEPNKRRHRRYDVEGVHGSLAYKMDAQVLNMSLTGMAMETGAMLKVGSNYRLQVPFEKEILDLPADVKWCHLVRTETNASGDVVPVYQAGIDFRSVLDEKARQILSFIESHIIVDLEQRLFGRFKIQDVETIELAESREFVVRRLSLSGMLIETGFSPQLDEVFDLEIRLRDQLVELRGRVANVHQIRSGRDSMAEIGVEFSGLEESQRRVFESFIEGLLE